MAWKWKADTGKRDQIDAAIKREHTLWADGDSDDVAYMKDNLKQLAKQREQEDARIKAAEADMNRKIDELNRQAR